MIKDSKYVKINDVNSLYLIFSKVNGYFEEIEIMVATNDESKEKIKNMKDCGLKSEIWLGQ